MQRAGLGGTVGYAPACCHPRCVLQSWFRSRLLHFQVSSLLMQQARRQRMAQVREDLPAPLPMWETPMEHLVAGFNLVHTPG